MIEPLQFWKVIGRSTNEQKNVLTYNRGNESVHVLNIVARGATCLPLLSIKYDIFRATLSNQAAVPVQKENKC